MKIAAVLGVVLALLALASARSQYYGQAPAYYGQAPTYYGQAPAYYGQAPAYYGQAPPPYYSCDSYTDCQNQGGDKVCGVNRAGFMSNYDNQCFMDRFNCNFGSSYQKKKDGGCWS